MTPGLILDLDETLYPQRQFIRSGFRAVAAEVSRRFEVPSPAVLARLLASLHNGNRGRALQEMCLHFDLPPTVVPDIVDVIRAHEPSLRLPLEARTLLVRARASGWRLGVLTNGRPEIQARKVRALGLPALVDTVVYAVEWGGGLGKPDREPFDVIRERLATTPALTVAVGDDSWCDIYGARNAGFHTILLHPAAGRVRASGADRVVGGLDEVLAAAEALVCWEVAHAA